MTGAERPTALGEPVLRSTEADRRAYLESGLRPVDCAGCGARVLVKKHSLAHTSIQWTGPAAACPVFAAAAGGPAPAEGCPKLRESIEDAVRDGLIEVPRENSG